MFSKRRVNSRILLCRHLNYSKYSDIVCIQNFEQVLKTEKLLNDSFVSIYAVCSDKSVPIFRINIVL